MPICPYCSHEIMTLYTSMTRNLIWYDKKWVVDISDDEIAIACSTCYEELGPKDLDKLRVSDKLR